MRINVYHEKYNLILKSVKSLNPCSSVIQTKEDIVKAYGEELKVETRENGGSEFLVVLPI
jgi:hypothetical protein